MSTTASKTKDDGGTRCMGKDPPFTVVVFTVVVHAPPPSLLLSLH
jgi:hypothetical protein